MIPKAPKTKSTTATPPAPSTQPTSPTASSSNPAASKTCSSQTAPPTGPEEVLRPRGSTRTTDGNSGRSRARRNPSQNLRGGSLARRPPRIQCRSFSTGPPRALRHWMLSGQSLPYRLKSLSLRGSAPSLGCTGYPGSSTPLHVPPTLTLQGLMRQLAGAPQAQTGPLLPLRLHHLLLPPSRSRPPLFIPPSWKP